MVDLRLWMLGFGLLIGLAFPFVDRRPTAARELTCANHPQLRLPGFLLSCLVGAMRPISTIDQERKE